ANRIPNRAASSGGDGDPDPFFYRAAYKGGDLLRHIHKSAFLVTERPIVVKYNGPELGCLESREKLSQGGRPIRNIMSRRDRSSGPLALNCDCRPFGRQVSPCFQVIKLTSELRYSGPTW